MFQRRRLLSVHEVGQAGQEAFGGRAADIVDLRHSGLVGRDPADREGAVGSDDECVASFHSFVDQAQLCVVHLVAA